MCGISEICAVLCRISQICVVFVKYVSHFRNLPLYSLLLVYDCDARKKFQSTVLKRFPNLSSSKSLSVEERGDLDEIRVGFMDGPEVIVACIKDKKTKELKAPENMKRKKFLIC